MFLCFWYISYWIEMQRKPSRSVQKNIPSRKKHVTCEAAIYKYFEKTGSENAKKFIYFCGGFHLLLAHNLTKKWTLIVYTGISIPSPKSTNCPSPLLFLGNSPYILLVHEPPPPPPKKNCIFPWTPIILTFLILKTVPIFKSN